MLTPADGTVGWLLGAVLLAVVTGFGGCAAGERPPNLLLVTVDTLRADHVGAWGYDQPTTPNLDALATQSVVFEQASAHSSWTLPSLASLMTSLHSSTHGCWTFKSRLAESFETLAETLDSHRYTTAAVVNHVFLGKRYGLDQGFQFFDEELVRRSLRDSHKQITSDEVTRRAMTWLREYGSVKQPWFLWVHYFDPHDLYQVHPGISEAFGTDTPMRRYDGEIAFTDHHIGRLIRFIDEAGFRKQTVVWIVGDHGEEFGDHGATYHGRTLYREMLHVPFMVRAPKVKPARVRVPVGLIDFLPTTLDLLELPVPRHLQGRSLVGVMRGAESSAAPILAEVDLFGRGVSVQQGDWKLVLSREPPGTGLFNLAKDPLERQNLAEAEPRRVKQMRALIETERGVARGLAGEYQQAAELQLSHQERRRLEALGYLTPKDQGP